MNISNKVYCYDKCSTCQGAKKFVEQREREIPFIDYTKCPPSANDLRAIWELSQEPLKKMLNTSGQLYRKMHLKEKFLQMNEQEVFELLSQHPMLIKRPLLIFNGKVFFGFKPAIWSNILEQKN